MDSQDPRLTEPNRSCDACRLSKVRCVPDSFSASKVCQRCSKTFRECLFTIPPRRKQHKRTHARVAELEREVSAMKALLEGKKEFGTERLTSLRRENITLKSTTQSLTEHFSHSQTLEDWNLHQENSPSLWKDVIPTTTQQTMTEATSAWIGTSRDVIGRGVISEELAIELFNTYVTDLAPDSPMVVFLPNTTADFVRRTKPTLFTALISAASGKTDPKLFNSLSRELATSYTCRTVTRSEKNLELVQTMIVLVTWYNPPGTFANLKFYE
jgi:hypothetical protein